VATFPVTGFHAPDISEGEEALMQALDAEVFAVIGGQRRGEVIGAEQQAAETVESAIRPVYDGRVQVAVGIAQERDGLSRAERRSGQRRRGLKPLRPLADIE